MKTSTRCWPLLNLQIEAVKREANNYDRMEWLNNAQKLIAAINEKR